MTEEVQLHKDGTTVKQDDFDNLKDGDWICSCDTINGEEDTACKSCKFPFPFDRMEEIEIIEEIDEEAGEIKTEVKCEYEVEEEEEREDEFRIKKEELIDEEPTEVELGFSKTDTWMCSCGGKNKKFRSKCVFCSLPMPGTPHKLFPKLKQPSIRDLLEINPIPITSTDMSKNMASFPTSVQNILKTTSVASTSKALSILKNEDFTLSEKVGPSTLIIKNGAGRSRGRGKPRKERPKKPLKPGQWICHECGTKVKFYRQVCLECNAQKPMSVNVEFQEETPILEKLKFDGMPRETFAKLKHREPSPEPSIADYKKTFNNLQPGDWICKCGEKVKAKRSACFFCKAPKSKSAQVPIKSNEPQFEIIEEIQLNRFDDFQRSVFKRVSKEQAPSRNEYKKRAYGKDAYPDKSVFDDLIERVAKNETDLRSKPLHKIAKKRPEEEITYSCQEDDIREKMQDPYGKILNCKICNIPIGDEKMLDQHYSTKAHRHKANMAVRDEQANDILTGRWHNRVTHREYWHAMGLDHRVWPVNQHFCDVTETYEPAHYVGSYDAR